MTPDEIKTLRGELGAVPRHIGIIMDGNGRWASERGMPRALGHRAGTARLRGIIRLTSDLGVEALSLYAFSTENWKRPQMEVETLFSLFMEFFTNEVDELHKNRVCIRALGDKDKLPQNVREACEAAERLTRDNTGLNLAVALNYGSLDEVASACRGAMLDAAAGKADAAAFDTDALKARLYTSGLPDVDLIIRTGGEKRLSNFLLLQAAYAELIFTDDYWPAFTDEKYITALREFASRHRRFGGLGGKNA